MTQYKDDLYDLIHSLTKAEKRYFKLFASTGENRYVQLFEVVNTVKIYNKKLLEKRLKNANLLDNLVANKNYLYGLILRSLRQFSEGKNIDSQIKILVDNAKILRKKKLYDKSYNQIKKAKNLAIRYEKLSLGLEILDQERELSQVISLNDDPLNVKLNQENEEMTEDFIRKKENQHLYFKLMSEIRGKGHKVYSQKSEGMEKFSEFLEHPLHTDINKALTLLAKQQFYVNRLHCFFYLRAYKAYHQDAIASVQLWENIEKDILMEYQHAYQTSLYNLILHELYFVDQATFLNSLERFKNILNQKHFKDSHPTVFIKSYGIEMHYWSSVGQLKKAMEVLEKSIHLFKKYEADCSIRNLVTATLSIARTYFYNDDMENASIWIDKLLMDYSNSQRKDILVVANTMRLLIYYEMNDTHLMEYLSRSIYRFTKRRKNLYDTPIIIGKYIKKLCEIEEEEDKRELYIKLKDALKEVYQRTHEKSILQAFDFIAWVDSKLEKKSLVDIFRIRAEKNPKSLMS
ncbi:MAG: hypothetical protein MK212_02115 [Saprospiraceae bacterium]|nr:hypothetical protein [Saprospiraceae bacterium]